MSLAAYHRLYELAWDGDPESSRRFRRILRALLVIVAIFGILFPLLPTPAPPAVETEVPPQLARIMIESKPKPPPPKPLVKPKTTPRPAVKETVKPAPERTDTARRRAERSIDQFKDQLAALRQQLAAAPVETRNLTGAVHAHSHAERSLITAQAGEASAGITSAPMSRGFGGGAGSLHGPDATRVRSSIMQAGVNARSPATGRGAGNAPLRGGDRPGLRPQQGRDLRALRAGVAHESDAAGQARARVHHRSERRGDAVPRRLERSARCRRWSARSSRG